MVLLTQPKGDDVFLDPFCGSGTIAFERAQLPARRVLASDISPEALEIARQNLPVAVRLQRCDARSLPHKDASIDAIASNIPWDVQIQVDDLLALYVDFLREAGRLLKPGGALVLLTDKQEALEAACTRTGWACRALGPVEPARPAPGHFPFTPLNGPAFSSIQRAEHAWFGALLIPPHFFRQKTNICFSPRSPHGILSYEDLFLCRRRHVRWRKG